MLELVLIDVEQRVTFIDITATEKKGETSEDMVCLTTKMLLSGPIKSQLLRSVPTKRVGACQATV